MVEFEKTKSDVDATNDLKSAIDQVSSTFPADASTPTVSKVDITDTPVYTFSVAGDTPTQIIYQQVKSLEDQIKAIPGVSDVSVVGKPLQEIKLVFDEQKLATLDMDFSSAVGQLKTAFVKFPVDKKDVDGKLYSFEVTSYDADLT